MQSLVPTPSCTCGCVCGAAKKMQSIREEETVFDFLTGLDDAYSTVRSQILSVDPLPNLGRAYAIAAQEEKQRSVTANRIPTIEATALLTKGGESRQRKIEDGTRYQFPPCIHCGKTNHNKDFCYTVIGYPLDWRKPGKKNSKHTNNDKMQFRGNQKNQKESNALTGVALAATTEGAMPPIPGLTHAQHQQLLALLGSHGAPTVTHLILRVWQPLIFQDLPSRMPIGVGRKRNGLYYLEPMEGGQALMVQKSVSASLWHRRLGHLPMNRISLVPSLSISFDGNKNMFCDACCKAKQTRLSFPTSMIKTEHAFDLIYCDIWGPYKTQSLSGSHYFLTIVDDFSRATWVFLMKNKSETKVYLLQFFNWVNTQFNL
ncbi:uncharacterized protein LOC132038046 [Lycium ferocissimum]|uniref:uncharacterized protein LOC132038046 n=1 Tax=Lycium ferocissimum TaxID=112874 RepID=UPI002814A85F|nr:uncharacterized protein LOC132038046 [Lycium ferocissimum]